MCPLGPMVHWNGTDSGDGVWMVGDILFLSIRSHGMDSGDRAWLGRKDSTVCPVSAIHSHGHQVE